MREGIPLRWSSLRCGVVQRDPLSPLAAHPAHGRDLSIADAFELPIDDAGRLFDSDVADVLGESARRRANRIVDALKAIGLGHLELGQPSPTLSGGEAQRVKLAKYLSRGALSGELLLLDEPSTGLHPANCAQLLAGLRTLVQAGTTIVVVEHNTEVIRSADWVIDLGPGPGPGGGGLVYQGRLAGLLESDTSATGPVLRRAAPRPVAHSRGTHGESDREKWISISNASVNNLKEVSVRIPQGSLTVVTGISGSGKSSLVRDVLEGEGRRRFLETLSMYERQGTRQLRDRGETHIDGLGVTVAVDPARLRYSVRSTVGTASGIHTRLAILLSTSDERICHQCGERMIAGESWQCPECGATARVLEPEEFFRSTYRAACQRCNGVGTLTAGNPDKLIVRPDLPLCAGAMYSPGFFPKGYLCKPFNGGYYEVQAFAKRHGFDPASTPWNEMSEAARNGFLYGEDEPAEVVFQSKSGVVTRRVQRFAGFFAWIGDWDIGGTYTEHHDCDACEGTGLRPEPRLVRIGDLGINDLLAMPVSDLLPHLTSYEPPAGVRSSVPAGAADARESAIEKARFLVRSGLGYISLDRYEGSLSAGEVQRVRLAGLLGSGLSGLTVLLDEPSRGMHPCEVSELIEVLVEFRDRGTTVVVVEHELEFVRAADWIIEMGPQAGADGGELLYAGPVDGLSRANRSHTAAWLSGGRAVELPDARRAPDEWCTLFGANEHNLDCVDFRVPLGLLTGVCGVSGSGKSTLVVETLARVLAPIKHTTSVAYEPIDPGEHDRVENPPSRTLVIDQVRAGLSTPGAFLKVEPHLFRLFAVAPDALDRGLSGADLAVSCEACGGRGRVRQEMGFLPAVHSTCEACEGTGLRPEHLDLTCLGVALGRIPSMTLDEIHRHFGDDEGIAKALGPARDLGLGYLRLRQPGDTLSGGEVQRLKITSELRRPRADLYILDEPTIGQHLEDVNRLIRVLRGLVDSGRSVVVVEHHPHLLAACDWLVELGPGAADSGGRIVATGTPEQIAGGGTTTAPYLRTVLEAG